MAEIEARKVKTVDVKKALETYASDYSIPISQCDFSIDKIEWHMKEVTTHEYEAVTDSVIDEYRDKHKILNEHAEFKQYLYITIKQQIKREIDLKYTIDYGEYSTHPKIILMPESKIPSKDYKPKELYGMLVAEINKIKALEGMLVDMLDETMMNNLKVFVSYIYEGKFTKKLKILLFDGIEPAMTRPSRLIMWFMENDKPTPFKEVQKGDVIAEYKKPKFSQNGLDAFGNMIFSDYAGNTKDLQAAVDKNSIKIIEDDDTKIYKSKKKGFVNYTGNYLSIKNKINFSKLSRNSNSIEADEDNNIEVMVSQRDTNVDSVGEGVKLSSETVHINGHVGAHSIVEALKLQINGATHKESSQFAKTAHINRHIGTLRCHDATIKSLEGGTVHATTVNIETAIGGSVYAQDVTIDHVKSHLKVYASNSITINLLNGEDNLLKINYKDIPVLCSKIDFINKQITALKKELKEAKEDNPSQVEGIQKKISEHEHEIDEIKDSAKKAQISIEKPIHGFNTIIFTVDDKNEIVFKTTDHTSYKPFHLVINDDRVTLSPTTQSIKIR